MVEKAKKYVAFNTDTGFYEYGDKKGIESFLTDEGDQQAWVVFEVVRECDTDEELKVVII